MIAAMNDDGPTPAAPRDGGRRKKRETWLDWLPPGRSEGQVITRAELLTLLAESGRDISERELRYWEAAGALPAPVRRFHHGAIHALYPFWYADVVRAVPRLRGAGLSWKEMRPKLREIFDSHIRPGISVYARLLPSDTAAPPLPSDLEIRLRTFVAELRDKHGFDVNDTNIVLFTTDQKRLWYHLGTGGILSKVSDEKQ